VAAPAAGDAAAAKLSEALRERALPVRVWSPPRPEPSVNAFTNFFTTYNRTALQRRVGDLLRECRRLRDASSGAPVVLCGVGRAGLWALLAAPGADAVVADACALDAAQDEALLDPELFCPGIRNVGTFEGAPMLAAPHPLWIHNTGRAFATDGIRAAYRALNAGRRLRIESPQAQPAAVAAWIARLKF
jgi:hypothetical protein